MNESIDKTLRTLQNVDNIDLTRRSRPRDSYAIQTRTVAHRTRAVGESLRPSPESSPESSIGRSDSSRVASHKVRVLSRVPSQGGWVSSHLESRHDLLIISELLN